MTTNIYEIIEQIQKRSEMYTGDKTLRSLSTFLSGLEIGLHICGVESKLNYEFHVWVREIKLGMDKSSIGYYNSLLEYNGDDEKKR